MFKFKTSTIMVIFLLLFLAFDLIGYLYLISNLKSSHYKDEKIIFYQLKNQTNKLLTQLLYEYSLKKYILRKKHIEVKNYLEDKNLDISLEEIHEKINKEHDLKPFDIYITDKNLKIVNTTFKPDLGFNLSFAKTTFDKHKKENTIGLSGPIFETFSTKFFSYTDEYIKNSNRILQVSYKYPNTQNIFNEIQKIIDNNQLVVKSNAYLKFKDGYIGDFIFKSFRPHKPSLKKTIKRINEGKILKNKIKNEIMIEEFLNDNTKYKALYFLQKSNIFNDAQIFYSVIFSQKTLDEKIFKLNIFIGIISIIGIFFIIALLKVRNNEIQLLAKDIFIKHSVHEIKTPLSIISLNNELRDKILGVDKYSLKITGAIKTLQNSYDDMSFLLTKNKINYKKENFNLANFLEQRVSYFKLISKTQGRNIYLEAGDFNFFISEIELTRLIDNNLSNAIKYSDINSTIKVTLKQNILIFSSQGKEIENKKDIFKKYKRENQIVGGHGLGLSIVQDICRKYKIGIDIKYEDKRNIFIYTF